MKKSMMNRYTKTEWRNGQAPALNAENLNHIENGLEAVTNEVIEKRVKTSFAHITFSESYDDDGVYIDEATDFKTRYVYKTANNVGIGILICSSVESGINLNSVCQIRFLYTGDISYRTGSAKVNGVRTWSDWKPITADKASAVLEITEESVPESAQWDDKEIPDDFSGDGYKLALWKEDLYYLAAVTEYEQTPGVKFYYWIYLATNDDLSDYYTKAEIDAKIGDIGTAIDTLNGNIDTLNTNLSEV